MPQQEEGLVLFSIIIPFQKECDYLIETIGHIKNLIYKNIEVVFLPDHPPDLQFYKNLIGNHFAYQVIVTGPVSPAIKRDQGANACKGNVLAFIDDDAFPHPEWLTHIHPHFSKSTICGVGGPQVTPDSDTFWQKVSGAMFLSVLNGAAVARYWPDPKAPREVDDWPSVNLCVRKSDFLSVGGFDSAYYPGEDTKLCLDLKQKLSKIIVYEEKAIVYHHRRAGFVRHLRQVGKYGLHRGYFAKKHPATSRKIAYFIPSLFFLFVTTGWALTLLHSSLTYLYSTLWLLYISALLASFLSIQFKVKNIGIAASTIPFIVGTHFWYGFQFLCGILKPRQLVSKLGR